MMWMEEKESMAFSSPLKFSGYSNVRYVTIGNEEEHLGIEGPESRANKLSNKGGHTAVSTINEGLILTILKYTFSKLMLTSHHLLE